MPQLEFSTYPSQIFWLLICIFFLISFMKHVFVPRMNFIFETRDKRIYGDLERTKELKEMGQSLRKEYNNKIHENKVKARHQQEIQLEEFELLREGRLSQLNRIFFRKRLLLQKEKLLHVSVDKKFQDILLKR